MKQGRASVWICEACGFFGFYKPEADGVIKRACPSCRNERTYMKTGDIALVDIESDPHPMGGGYQE